MTNNGFVHLHVHSEYSLLDGSAKIAELVSKTAEMGMGALAITDHGAMFGVIDFYKAAKEAGIKPILGCEVYVATTFHKDRDPGKGNSYYHLVLLAENEAGYHNLVKLVSIGYVDGFYYRPRVDLELLREYNEGLIALSACLSGPVPRTFLDSGYEKALEMAVVYDEVFGRGNFFLELQDHGMEEQKPLNTALIRMSEETGIPLAATNDVHYISADDAAAHDVLMCIQTGKTVNDTDRLTYHGDQFYLKSPEEMASLFSHCPSALENTAKIAERCNVEIRFHEYKLPKFNIPEGKTPDGYLREVCEAGFLERFPDSQPEVRERLDYELSVITDMGYAQYFLVVWDAVRFARESGINIGVRGSGNGSVVNYVLYITNVDPIRFNIIFERFLNPERISMPDIDLDICYERRQEVIDYVNRTYGEDHVAQIITFGTMAARAAIRDVGRALGMLYGDVDIIAKMVPFSLGMTIERALEINADLRRKAEEDEQVRVLIDMARKLEGLPRHASTHAAGVLVCDKPVDEYIPLNTNDGLITTQFSMNTLEELGLLKFDFLGLRTLTVIQKTILEAERRHGVKIDTRTMDYDDKNVYELISQGKTDGMFQIESQGMKNFMKELKPTSLDDIMAGIALFRPGPMDFIPKYVRNKHNRGQVMYTHPALEPILRETYGCIVYQEQVIQIVRELAGYSYARGDLIRRAMSKKKPEVMAIEKEYFINGLAEENVPGCVKNGIPREAAERIWGEMEDFASYAFPKGHSAGYAYVVYQTAWLKYYYPLEFMAALLTSVMDRASSVAAYIAECKKMNLTVKPPDVNFGYGHFTATDNGILFGLNAIKNVGRPTIAAIVAEREAGGPFRSLTEFITRLDGAHLNKRAIECLIRAGAFDSMGGRRSQYMHTYEAIITGQGNMKKSMLSGQLSLLDVMPEEEQSSADMYSDDLPDIPEFSLPMLLLGEKEMLGIYVSGHPVLEYEEEFKKYTTVTSVDFAVQEDDSGEEAMSVQDGASVTAGGIVSGRVVKYTKKNEAMAFVTMEDLFGELELIVFPNLYEKYSQQLVTGTAIVATGRVSVKEGEAAKLVCNSLKILRKNEKTANLGELWLKLPKDSETPYSEIMALLSKHRGNVPVAVYDERTGQRMRVSENYWINAGDERLMVGLKSILGDKSVVLRA